MELFTLLFFLIVTLWLIWRWRIFSTFQKLGIPGPPPNILFGNLLELYQKGPLICHKEWVEKYGRVVGYYLGATPTLLIADPMLLKNIFIKDFSKFMNRESFNPIVHYHPDNKLAQSVLTLPGDAWKSVRSILTPTFTSAKMKQMSKSMNSSIDDMMNNLKKLSENQNEFNIFDTFQRITLDVISRTAFGLKTDVQTDAESRMLRATSAYFKTLYRDPLIFIGQSFPLLRKLCVQFLKLRLMWRFKGRNPLLFLSNGITEVLQLRRQTPQPKNSDFLQIMIDNTVFEESGDINLSELEAGNLENESKSEKEEESNKKVRGMSDDEITSTALVVLLAGYETTSTALAFSTYYLAKYPDVQEKLYEEIDALFQNDKQLEYATVNKLNYLDKVFSESLRISPPVYLFTNRYALTDVQYANIKIPKGMLVRAPTYLMHHDPEFWENPEEFDPERFSAKPNSNGITYFPFGVGPRNCLGMRFAQLEAKLVLANIIHKFRIDLAERNRVDLPISLRIRTLTPDGVWVKLEKRNDYYEWR